MRKIRLRKQLKRSRASLSVACRAEYSSLITRRLCASSWFTDARIVCAYSGLFDEVDSEGILNTVLCDGKVLALPRVEGPGVLSLRRVDDLRELRPGAFGVLEPTQDSVVVPPSAVDLFVVPGLGFDRAGRRMGYGQGYYDRTLASVERAANHGSTVVGLCFGIQLVSEVPVDGHDQPMDAVITESAVIVREAS